jgi:hypothetical protein
MWLVDHGAAGAPTAAHESGRIGEASREEQAVLLVEVLAFRVHV